MTRHSPATRNVKPVGFEAAMKKPADAPAGGSLPRFWFMEDEAGMYKSIMNDRPAGPEEHPSPKAPTAFHKKEGGASTIMGPLASPPQSPPAAPTPETWGDQPAGAEDSPKISSGSWAKVAASAPLPSPMMAPSQFMIGSSTGEPRTAGVTLLSDFVSAR